METGLTLRDLTNRLLPPSVRRDPIRNEKRVKLRVQMRDGLSATNLCGNRIRAGKAKKTVHEIVVYKSQVPDVMARVEDCIDEIKRAQERLDRERKAWLEKRLRGVSAYDQAEEEREALRAFDRQETEARNVEAYFYQAKGRGILPLVKCEEVGELAPPQDDEDRRQGALVDALAEALARVLQTQPSDGKPARNR